MSNESPAAILFDESGHPIGVIFDGTFYRLATQTVITDGYGNGPAAVMPPYTAADSSNPALVVTLSPNNPITTTPARPSTNNTSNVAASITNVELLASNSIRLGATIFNDSSSLLYIKLGVTASSNDFTIKLFPACYYEIPFGYTGEVDGLWVSAVGYARIGELSP